MRRSTRAALATLVLAVLTGLAAPAAAQHDSAAPENQSESANSEQQTETESGELPLFMRDGPWMRGVPAEPTKFSCNGDKDEQRGFYWLATSNPYKFRRHYTARYFFTDLPESWNSSDYFWVEVVAKVYDQSPELGGAPDDAGVRVVVRNPNTDEEYSTKNVVVETNDAGRDLPAFVQVPTDYVAEDGRVEVRVEGAGSIGLSRDRMRLFFPKRPSG